MENQLNSRIGILDGFRALAIVAVILFHFFCLYTPPASKENLYPYGNKYDYFHYGYLGVEFFFIISGFVIYFTLERTGNFRQFWVKRIIRLWPSIFIASVSIFLFFSLLDPTSQGGQIQNFISSLTFVTPDIINPFLEKVGMNFSVNYLDGSFWSLWVEIQFYLFASLIYYHFKNKFFPYFLFATLGVIGLNLILQNVNGKNYLNLPYPDKIYSLYEKVFKGFNIIKYLPFFAIGLVFYHISKNKGRNLLISWWVYVILGVFISYVIYSAAHLPIKLAFFVMFVLFSLFVFFPKSLRLFEAKPMRKIGESSYFLYLIHQNIGMYFIVTFGVYFLPYGFIFPALLILFFIYISLLYTYKIDAKINRWLKLKLKAILVR